MKKIKFLFLIILLTIYSWQSFNFSLPSLPKIGVFYTRKCLAYVDPTLMKERETIKKKTQKAVEKVIDKTKQFDTLDKTYFEDIVKEATKETEKYYDEAIEWYKKYSALMKKIGNIEIFIKQVIEEDNYLFVIVDPSKIVGDQKNIEDISEKVARKIKNYIKEK